MKLPFSTCLHDDESATSFASRLAWVNGIPSIVDLLKDARLSLADFLKGDRSALIGLAALGDVPVQRLTHRAFILKGKSSFEIAGHEIGQHNLLRGIHRICPACFRADTGGLSRSKPFQTPTPAFFGHWPLHGSAPFTAYG